MEVVDLNREYLAKKYGYLINLTDINITCSQIKRIDSNAFEELTNLVTLWLPNNSIKDIDKRSFESLSNLKSLHLSNNKLKRIDSNTFKNLINLEYLWLHENQIEEIDVKLFASFSNLKGLYLYNNKLKVIDRKCFQPLKSIEVVILYENIGLNALSFIKPSTNIWYDEEKIEKYGSVSEWNGFLQQFPELEISVDLSKQSASLYYGAILFERYSREQNPVIGSGTYGIVYKVLDRNTDQQELKPNYIHKSKAMKQIKIVDDKSKREFKNMMHINHENVVKYFDHFYHTIEFIEYIFIITEFCENKDLEKKIRRVKAEKKKFSEKEIFGWILQATSGLKYLHSDTVRMVHRDVKPENMLLSKENVVKLADLGTAKVLCGTLRRTGTYAGTLEYMSPELERCKGADEEEGKSYSFNADVWSLGCVLYELIHLNKAFPKGFAIANTANTIPSLTGCGSFTNILQKMLDTEPNSRIDSKDLYELMMKSTFDIKEDSSKAIEEKNRRGQEAKEKEQRKRLEREGKEYFDLYWEDLI